jgi:type I restriction enzyme S subunit
MSQFDLANHSVPIPSTQEQQKIAQFLDYETAKIDALIDEQKRLIELLKEKRQAVISHAVTKGLNPDAPMKDSGVEWLGEVPEHWKLTKLGYLGNAIIGLTYSPDDIIDEGGAIVLRSTNIQNGRVSLHDNVHVSKKISDKLRLRVGDILICSRNGSRALIGKNALIDESAAGHTFGAFTTVFRSTYNPFLRYIFDSRIFSAQAGLFMTTTVNQLTTGTLNQMQIALPPVNEQTEIIEYLDDEVMRVEFLTSECKLSLKLLQERRSALISAAVTGKIDVRDWQPPEGSDTVNSNASVQTERHYG